MFRWNARIWLGGGLVLLGLLMLLERFGLFQGVLRLFWGAAFLAASLFFFSRFMHRMDAEWWTAIPAFGLLGLAASSLLGSFLPDWSGAFFLGALGLGFLTIYLGDRSRWWALIPAGVLLTLAFNSVLSDAYGVQETGGFFFLGLGLTFLLVAVLASLQWAWIPGVVLLVMAGLIGIPIPGSTNYLWPAALIAGGLLLVLQFARKQ